MESAKRDGSYDEDNSIKKSPYTTNPSSSWTGVRDEYDTTEYNSRKRKKVTESEISENDNNISSEKTVLVPKRENVSSLCPDQQPSELYGLKRKFLESLGIIPPLSKWVYVNNFRCDKTELKEVFELAGHVVICSVVAIRERYASIMYSHPLEAVQAISMFNGQILYGMKLKVTMINPPGDTIVLPKGLKDVGPGLGFNGRPLRDIVKHYNKYTKHQLSLVDASLFCRQNDDDEDEDEKELLDGKNTDLNVKSKGPEENNGSSSRRKYFKITNVEDLPVKDTSQDSSHNTSDKETQSKKPRLEEPDEASSSDEESSDARIVSNFKAKLKGNDKTTENEVTKDPRLGANSIQTIGNNIRPFNNPGTKNFQPPMKQPMGVQFRPNPPIGNAFPPRPMGSSGPMGPTGPVGPFQASGPPMAPVGPTGPVIAPGPNGPMMPPVGVNGPMAPLHPNGPMGPFGPPTGPVGPPAGMINTMGPSGPFGSFRPPGPNVPPTMPGPNPGLGPPMIRGNGPLSGPNQPMPNDVITLQFRNLPPSTTFPLLCDRVSQCGQVLSLQLTTPGCAVARFAHRVHAERCFQYFNGKCIDGCVIAVRFA